MTLEGLPYQGPWMAEATQIISSFSAPTDIDRLVLFLRNRHYPTITGGRTPLLVSDSRFEGYMLSANHHHILKPAVLASAFWNHFLEEEQYFGTSTNLQARLVRRDIAKDSDRLCLPQRFIDPESVIAFEVSGELYSTDGRIDGVVNRRYALYLSSKKYYEALSKAHKGVAQLRQNVQDLLDQAELMYSRDAVYTEPILWLSSDVGNYLQNAPGLGENRTRFQRAILNAKALERYAKLHPAAGGLPGLGKNSR